MKIPGTRSKSRKKELLLRLETVWKRPENQQCIDCGEQNTSYASILGPVLGASKKQRLGVFCCHKCCNYHMTLGRGVCFVKNLKTADDMKDWTEDEIRVLEGSGNEVTNGIYEKNLTIKKPSPTDYDAMQAFVQNKYHPEKLRYICQEKYEAHHGFWSAKYKEMQEIMNEMATEMAANTSATTTTTAKGSAPGTASSSSSKTPAPSYGPKHQSDSPLAVKNSSLTGGSTAPTECESSVSETGIPAWEPSWEPEPEKTVTDNSNNNNSNSEDDDEEDDSNNNNNEGTDLEGSNQEKPDEMSISSQVTARLAGRRASSAISQGRRTSDQSRRERRHTSTLDPSDLNNRSMSSFAMDPYHQSTTTPSHSRSPAAGAGRMAARRESRRLSNEASPKTPDLSKSPNRRTGLMTRQGMSTRRLSSANNNNESGGGDRRASLRNRSASQRLLAATNDGHDAITSHSDRPGLPSPRRMASRRSLSSDGGLEHPSSSGKSSSSLHGNKEMRRLRSQNRKSLNKSRSFDMDCTDDDDDPEEDDHHQSAAEKPRPSPRRSMSRRSLSTDGGADLKAVSSLHGQKELRRMRSQRRNSCDNSDQELEDGGGGESAAAEKPRPSPRRGKPRRSLSTDGSTLDMKGVSSSLHKIRSQRRHTGMGHKSFSKSKNFDFDPSGDADPDLEDAELHKSPTRPSPRKGHKSFSKSKNFDFDPSGDADPDLEDAELHKSPTRPSPRKSKSRRSLSTDGGLDAKIASKEAAAEELRNSTRSNQRKSSLNKSKSFDVDCNGSLDLEDLDGSEDESAAERQPPPRSSNHRNHKSRRSLSTNDGLGTKEKQRERRGSQRRSSLNKSKSLDTDYGNENDSDDSCDEEESAGGGDAQEIPIANRKANIRLAVGMLANMNNKTDRKDLADGLFNDDNKADAKKKSKVDRRREASLLLNNREEVSLILGA